MGEEVWFRVETLIGHRSEGAPCKADSGQPHRVYYCSVESSSSDPHNNVILL